MFDQRCGLEASPCWVRQQYSWEDSWEKVERRDWDDNKHVF